MDILTSPVNGIAYSSLDVLVYQQKLLAENIANANTEGYQVQYLNFDAVMAELSNASSKPVVTQQLLEKHTVTSGKPVELDMQMVQLQETVMQYKTMLDILSRKGALMKTVLGGQN